MCAENPTSNVFVVDTDKYSGNFEREMCAFITGQVGECGVGDNIAEEEAPNIKNLQWFEDNVAQEADEYECLRPASIWPTLGRFNDGYGGHHDDTPEVRASLGKYGTAKHPAYESVAVFLEELPPQEVLTEMVERAKAYCEQTDIAYKGYRLLRPVFHTVTVQEQRVSRYDPA